MFDDSIIEALTDSEEKIVVDIGIDEFKWKFEKYGFREKIELVRAIKRLEELEIIEPVNTVYAKGRGNGIPFANEYRLSKEFEETLEYY